MTAVVNTSPDSKTSLLMKDKMSKVNTVASETQSLYDERLEALELALDAGDKFWTGLGEIKHNLKDVQEHMDSEEPPAAELDVLEEQMHDHQVRFTQSFDQCFKQRKLHPWKGVLTKIVHCK